MKTCTKCGVTGSEDLFGTKARCKKCQKVSDHERYVARRDANPEAIRANARRYWAENRERISAHRKATRQPRRMMQAYGLTQEDYLAMMDAQGGGCKICGIKSNRGRKFCVDHDHESGRVRGLLCDRCNRGIGSFDDDADLLHRAAWYLDQVETALVLAESGLPDATSSQE